MIHLNALTFSYKNTEQPALSDVSIRIRKKNSVIVMGGSGAGKSTLLYSMNGIVPHFFSGDLKGEITVNGHRVQEKKVNELACDVGMVFQDFESQLFSTNVAMEVAFGPENLGVPTEEIARRVDDCLQLVGLSHLKDRMPSTLSGGQKQRLAIAAVLSMNPSILCLDEPTTDLDPIGKEDVFRIALDLIRNDEKTVIFAEHETDLAVWMDQMILIKDGEVVACDHPGVMLRNLPLLRATNVMPLQITELFEPFVSSEQLPITLEEALELLSQLSPFEQEGAYARILEFERERALTYGDPIIEVRGLCKSYGAHDVLKGIDFTLHKGEFVALLGQNGSGKSTFVKHLNALLFPTAGDVLLNGRSTEELGLYQVGKHVGFVFQNPDHQIFSETVFDEVAFTLKMRQEPKELIFERVQHALEAVGLKGYEERDPFSLTKGERQRIAVASILATSPDVLILDEPTTGLDYAEQRSMMEMIKKLNEQGHTIVMVTHSMWVVAEYAHRAVVIHEGNLLCDGPVREVLADEATLEAARLRPPQVMKFGIRIGMPLLSVAEGLQIWCKEVAIHGCSTVPAL